MIDQLCQAYHWSWGEALSMTMPQIIMLNHAAWVNSKRQDERLERKRKRDEEEKIRQEKLDEDDPIVFKGKRLSQLNSDEMTAYYSDFGVI